jgi:hypothetical protein
LTEAYFEDGFSSIFHIFFSCHGCHGRRFAITFRFLFGFALAASIFAFLHIVIFTVSSRRRRHCRHISAPLLLPATQPLLLRHFQRLRFRFRHFIEFRESIFSDILAYDDLCAFTLSIRHYFLSLLITAPAAAIFFSRALIATRRDAASQDIISAAISLADG